MQRSETRILTTHAGSLPRPKELVAMQVRLSRKEPVDAAALDELVERSTRRVIAAQLAAGIDIGNNGEQARESFFTYVQHRLSGFGGQSNRPIMKDIIHYAELPGAEAAGFLAHHGQPDERAEGCRRGPLRRSVGARERVRRFPPHRR